MAKKRSTKKDTAQKVGIGLGVAGLVAAAAAGGYFLYGPQGNKNRKKVKGWMLKAKGEVLEKMEKLREIDQAAYEKIVDQVVDRYAKMKTVTKQEADELSQDLKKHWKQLYNELMPHLAPTKKAAKRSAKKTVKKEMAKKAVKKSAKKVAKKAS